jgi:hypothetical protein
MYSKVFKIIIGLFMMMSVASAEIITQQSFEKLPSDTWGFTTDPAPYYNGGTYSIFHSDSIGFPSYLENLPDGDKLWNCENTGGTNSAIHEITFNTIDLSSYTGELSLNFYYFAFRYKDSAGDDPWTSTDHLIGYYVEFDNGSTWNTLNTLATGTDGWIPVSVNIPEGSDYVRLRFVVKNLGWQEIGTFDYVYIERTDTPLPITLSDFQASLSGSGVKLTWRTESEIENRGFNLYRNGEKIAFIEGAGTTNETKEYTYFDNTALIGSTYEYVLSDLSYANIETIHRNMATALSITSQDMNNKSYRIEHAYPNPFNPQTTIDFTLTESSNVEIMVFNMTGDKIADLFRGVKSSGVHQVTWNANSVMSGIYFLKITIGNKIETQKLLLVK